jgi:fumarylacetoacetase
MHPEIDHTCQPNVKSWVESANAPGVDFPIQNLPLGLCRRRNTSAQPHICTAIGDYALDLSGCLKQGLLIGATPAAAAACGEPSLNALMALGQPHWSSLRRTLHDFLREAPREINPRRKAIEENLWPLVEAEFFVPAHIGDYTDFYASRFHASRVGKLFRPENPLPANYDYVPIGYHGRASSIVISGTPVRRPTGQARDGASGDVRFGPTQKLDYEAEIGFFVGPGNSREEPIRIDDSAAHIFGLCLLNDWSARDIQAWESQPLGPFLSKNFATSISPWVVTMDALMPFRTPALARPEDQPAPLPYLTDSGDQKHGGLDLNVEVLLCSRRMRLEGHASISLSRGNAKDLYWTIAQLLTHHTVTGCNLRPGDLLASGTVSGAEQNSAGCLLELTAGGAEPIRLPTGETRSFLDDGDEVTLRAWCESPGYTRIGFGECRGTILTATPLA